MMHVFLHMMDLLFVKMYLLADKVMTCKSVKILYLD